MCKKRAFLQSPFWRSAKRELFFDRHFGEAQKENFSSIAILAKCKKRTFLQSPFWRSTKRELFFNRHFGEAQKENFSSIAILAKQSSSTEWD
ncbi:MAG: hypothetical protein ACK5L5_11360 [Bacteroidales bacterium]